MEEYIKLVQKVLGGFKTEDLGKTFNQLDIDSMDLVMLRVSFEKKYGRVIPASVWLNITSIQQIIEFYEN